MPSAVASQMAASNTLRDRPRRHAASATSLAVAEVVDARCDWMDGRADSAIWLPHSLEITERAPSTAVRGLGQVDGCSVPRYNELHEPSAERSPQ